jgi:hypothetical protein
MTGVGLLHNMSVPPRSTVTVRRSKLPGTRYALDCSGLSAETVDALRIQGAAAALALIAKHADLPASAAMPSVRAGDADSLLATCMTTALRAAEIPERIGVFLDDDVDALTAPRLKLPATLALLARRSGPLYLPRRSFQPSLITPTTAILVFPA